MTKSKYRALEKFATKRNVKPALNKDLLSVASKDDKLQLISMISKEICNSNTQVSKQGNRTVFIFESNHRKIDDLLVLCEDSSIEVVIAAIKQLIFVFCDILPDYKIREEINTQKEGKVTLSKDVRKLREQEAYLLDAYKRFLQILETFSKFKCINMSDSLKKKYMKLKIEAFDIYSICLGKLSHFNYIKNIIKVVASKLASKVTEINKICTKAIFDLMSNKAVHTQELKLFAIEEIAKQLKSRPHVLFQSNILECLGLHNIIIRKDDIEFLNEETVKIEQLKKEVRKKFRKGKFSEARDQKMEIIKELKEADAIGVDIEKSSSINNKIIMAILGIYFDFLKNRVTSPLLRGVFLHLPNFATHVNIEIVWDLLNVLREYVDVELKRKKLNLSNLITALLCCFQIITIGAGNAFNDVEEKDFSNCLYNTTVLIMNEISTLHITDLLAYLKTVNIALIQKRQYSNDLLMAFLRRLSLLALHSPVYFQCGVLLFIKRIINKYPNTKGVIDFGFLGTETTITKEDERIITNEDPQLLINVHQISIYTSLGR